MSAPYSTKIIQKVNQHAGTHVSVKEVDAVHDSIKNKAKVYSHAAVAATVDRGPMLGLPLPPPLLGLLHGCWWRRR